MKSCKSIKSSLEITYEITKLIKRSPRREELFRSLKSEHEHLSQTLQSKKISAAEGQRLAKIVIDTLGSLRTSDNFEIFWTNLLLVKESHDIDDPQLPRKRRQPQRYNEVTGSAGHFHDTPKAHYCQIYYDNTVGCLKNRFDQPGYKTYMNLEQLLTNAILKEDFKQQLQLECDFYDDDLDRDLLRAQLLTSCVDFRSKFEGHLPSITIFDILEYFRALSSPQHALLSAVCKVLQLVVVLPSTNATSERSFSTLRRVKTYLRSKWGKKD